MYIGDYAVISTTGGTRKVEYLLKDRLGSVDAVTNSSGAVIETRGYDAFGKPRNGTWNDLSPAKIASVAVTPKGFTQHEHLNQLELIHMNGRAYDYNLGRFTGVDPFIQFPLNSQSLNPYSYILNNPLSGTDPTGYLATGSHIHDSTIENTGATISYQASMPNDNGKKENASDRPAPAASGGSGTPSNGSQTAQTVTGVDKRDSKETPIAKKGDVDREIETVTVVGDKKKDLVADDQIKMIFMRLKLSDLSIREPGKETKFYLGQAGVLASTQNGCDGDDRCQYSKKDVKGIDLKEILLLGHTHADRANKIQSKKIDGVNDIINDLSRNSPGPGDDAPLMIDRLSGIITPDGYRYIIERRNGLARAAYVGGGSDPEWGRYVEKNWTPGDNQAVLDMARNFYNEKKSTKP